MSKPRSRSPRAVRHGIDLALAAPQVVALRAARLAAARTPLSVRHQRELMTMGLEKVVAFQQSWLAMGFELARMQQQAALSLWQAAWMPWSAAARLPWSTREWQRAAMGIAGAGIRPVRHMAVANARRLRRSRR